MKRRVRRRTCRELVSPARARVVGARARARVRCAAKKEFAEGMTAAAVLDPLPLPLVQEEQKGARETKTWMARTRMQAEQPEAAAAAAAALLS